MIILRLIAIFSLLSLSLNSNAGIPTKEEPKYDSVSSASGYVKDSHISDDPKERAVIITNLCKFVDRNQHEKFFALLAEQQLRLERIYQEIDCGELQGESLMHVVLNKVSSALPTGKKIVAYFKRLKAKHPKADIAAIFNTPYSKGTILDALQDRRSFYGEGAPEKIKANLKQLESLLREVGAKTSSAG